MALGDPEVVKESEFRHPYHPVFGGWSGFVCLVGRNLLKQA